MTTMPITGCDKESSTPIRDKISQIENTIGRIEEKIGIIKPSEIDKPVGTVIDSMETRLDKISAKLIDMEKALSRI